MATKPRSFRSKFRTFRIWLYILFGFSFFLFSTASAFASTYSMVGAYSRPTPDAACSLWASTTYSSRIDVTSSVSNVTSNTFGCTAYFYTVSGGTQFSAGAQGYIYPYPSCPPGQVFDPNSASCSVPSPLAVGSSCDMGSGTGYDPSNNWTCLPSGQACEAGLTLSDPAHPGQYLSSSGTVSKDSCTYDPNATTHPTNPVTPTNPQPPIDPNSCGSGSVSVGSSCYPATGSQCGTVNGNTVCVGGATPVPPVNVITDPATGKAVTSSAPVPPPTYSGNLGVPPTSIAVYGGFSQGGGALPTTPADSSGNCPPGYGTLSNGSNTVCVADGTYSGGSGSTSSNGSGSGNEQQSNCGGSGQPACGGEPDNGGACPAGTSQITVDRGKNGTDSICVPVTDPNTFGLSGLNQSALVSGYASQPSLTSIPTHDGAVCPAAYTFSVFGSSYSISFDPLCELAGYIKPIVIAAGYITLAVLVATLIRIF